MPTRSMAHNFATGADGRGPHGSTCFFAILNSNSRCLSSAASFFSQPLSLVALAQPLEPLSFPRPSKPFFKVLPYEQPSVFQPFEQPFSPLFRLVFPRVRALEEGLPRSHYPKRNCSNHPRKKESVTPLGPLKSGLFPSLLWVRLAWSCQGF